MTKLNLVLFLGLTSSLHCAQEELSTGQILLFEAVSNSDIKAVRQLISQGINVDFKIEITYGRGQSLLEKALDSTDEIFNMLLDGGADINKPCDSGFILNQHLRRLAYSREDHLQFVVFLLERGADPNIKDNFGLSPLGEAKKILNNFRTIRVHTDLYPNGAGSHNIHTTRLEYAIALLEQHEQIHFNHQEPKLIKAKAVLVDLGLPSEIAAIVQSYVIKGNWESREVASS